MKLSTKKIINRLISLNHFVPDKTHQRNSESVKCHVHESHPFHNNGIAENNLMI